MVSNTELREEGQSSLKEYNGETKIRVSLFMQS